MHPITVPKFLLSVLFLLVIPQGVLHAADRPQVYRFGGWTLITPPEVDNPSLEAGPVTLVVPEKGIEFLAYWQDGSERALALRFHSTDPKQDVAAMKSYRSTRRLYGCELGPSARIKSLERSLPPEGLPTTLPEASVIELAGSDRGLRRVSDVLVADLGIARVQIAEDSPVVRLGEWGSADFCRFELKSGMLGDEE